MEHGTVDGCESVDRRLGRALAGVVATALLAAVAVGVGAGTGVAQSGPTFGGPVGKVQVEDLVRITVTGCPEGPTGYRHVQFDDVLHSIDGVFEPGSVDGTWDHIFAAPDRDVELHLECAGASADLYVDVDNPMLVPTPIDGGWKTGVSGTDCALSEASLTLSDDAGVTSAAPATDEHGNWHVEFGQVPSELVVEATCGDLTYPTLIVWGPGSPSTTTPPTSTVPPGSSGPPSAQPAVPVAASPGYTG